MRGGLEDTICAIATPTGEGGVGIVRLSGSEALSVAGRIARLRSRKPLSSLSTHTVHLAEVFLPFEEVSAPEVRSRDRLDEALLVYMRAPRSFTGEDVVEIQSHGGPVVLGLICEACIAAGARMAEPGEFTKRAFLNGRLDLSQAEAVLDTIQAKSKAALLAAQRQLRGELSHEVEAARSVLLMAMAQVEAGIDFVEEDMTFLSREELLGVLTKAWEIVHRLEATRLEGKIVRDGAKVVILGRPNVGKSSLMNRLLKENRSIVTDVPGTTRDVIEETVELSGVVVRLVDTAGIRETSDVVEQEGVKRTNAARESADLILVVVDGSDPLTSEDREVLRLAKTEKSLVLVNKCDLPSKLGEGWCELGERVICVSAKSGEGLDSVREAIRRQLVSAGGDAHNAVVVTSVRHGAALRRAAEALKHSIESAKEGFPCEVITVDLREAADALGEITGSISSDDVLERIFSSFCIGK